MNDVINDKELKTVVEILKKLEPGILPFDIFHQFARLYVTPIVEVVPLKKQVNGDITTILLRRDINDPVWPGMQHTSGTVIRASDKAGSFEDAFDRIIDELCGLEIEGKPQFVTYKLHKVDRGMEMAMIFFVEYNGKIKCGDEVNVNKLPKDIVKTQLEFINEAVNKFKKGK